MDYVIARCIVRTLCVRVATVVAAGSIACAGAVAQPAVSSTRTSECAVVIDFEDLPIGVVSNPLQYKGVSIWTPGDGLGIFSVMGFGAHGGAVFGKTLIPRPRGTTPLGIPFADIEIVLPRNAREVSLGWFDPNFEGNELRAYSSDGVLLESVTVPTFATGGCCAAYIGISRDMADISKIVARVSSPLDVYAIDNIHITYGFTQPHSSAACIGTSSEMAVTLDTSPNTSYQWYRNGEALGDGPTAWGSSISGSATETLRIDGIAGEDAGAYVCVLEGLCGVVVSDAAYLDVFCDCGSYEAIAGVADGFALPADPALPSPEFAATIRPRMPLAFDRVPGVGGAPTDTPVMHTFAALPKSILTGSLTMRVRAGDNSGGEFNDAVRLGFTQDGGFGQRWARFLGTGASDPGLFDVPWSSGVEREIDLDLGSLLLANGSTANVLGEMADAGYLDVLVGDDTGVDFMHLRLTGSEGRVVPWVGAPIGPPQGFESGRVEISAETGGMGGPFTYHWQFNGFDIDTAANPTAATSVLVLDPLLRTDEGEYRCVVSGANTCEQAISSSLILRVLCRVDYNTSGDEGDILDFLDFIADFSACDGQVVPCGQFGEPDFNGDGVIDILDLLDFLQAFDQGC